MAGGTQIIGLGLRLGGVTQITGLGLGLGWGVHRPQGGYRRAHQPSGGHPISGA